MVSAALQTTLKSRDGCVLEIRQEHKDDLRRYLGYVVRLRLFFLENSLRYCAVTPKGFLTNLMVASRLKLNADLEMGAFSRKKKRLYISKGHTIFSILPQSQNQRRCMTFSGV